MMPKKSSWLDEITKDLESRGSQLYKPSEVIQNATLAISVAGIPVQVNHAKLIEALLKRGLRRLEIRPVTASRQTHRAYKPIERYAWGSPSNYEIALSLRGGSYLSHGTAVTLHGLIADEVPERIYVNKEQSSKPTIHGVLTQSAVDRAFKNEARGSNYVYGYSGVEIVLLNGKHTRNLGVVEQRHSQAGRVVLTGLERTLIDIAVRPQYAGGIEAVLEAFRAAKHKVSCKALSEMLTALGYIYPYHQAIGFYLTRAGYPDSDKSVFSSRGAKIDFYLGNRIKRPLLDKDWRIYYPPSLNNQREPSISRT